MSMENASRFMMLVKRDQELKAKFDSIMRKHDSKDLSRDECEKFIKVELIPFARELGYEFSLEDMKELEKPAESSLSDEDLEKVAGGRGMSSADIGRIQNITINGGELRSDGDGKINV